MNIIDNISTDRLQQIEQDREQIQSLQSFQQWCKDMNIGSRVEVKDHRAIELTNQYRGYLQWIKREEEKRRWMPDFIVDMF